LFLIPQLTLQPLAHVTEREIKVIHIFFCFRTLKKIEMNFSSTPTMPNRGPSSHHEFFAKLYGAFDDKNKNDKNESFGYKNKHEVLVEREDPEENICVDDDIDVDSDSDNSTMSLKNDDRMKSDALLHQSLSPSLPSLGHSSSGIKKIIFN
jgi:hypothetical protein